LFQNEKTQVNSELSWPTAETHISITVRKMTHLRREVNPEFLKDQLSRAKRDAIDSVSPSLTF
jgi:hypothetical protein